MQWIRIWTHKTIHSTTFTELNLMERGMWFSLLIMAGANERNPGIVELRDGVAYSDHTLAELLSCTLDEFTHTRTHLTTTNKIEILPDNRIAIKNWDKYQTRYEKYYKEEGINNGIRDGIKNCMRMQGRRDKIRRDKKKIRKDIDIKKKNIYVPFIKEFFAYYNSSLKNKGWIQRDLLLTHERLRLIVQRLKDGYTLDDLKACVDAFCNDTWDRRGEYIALTYVIGLVRGVNQCDKWLNRPSKRVDPLMEM